MNRTDLVHELAERAGIKPARARQILDLLFGSEAVSGVIPESLDRGDRVSIAGFGSFAVRQRAERNVRDPQTGQKLRIPACRTAVFRPGTGLRSLLR